MKKKKIYKIDTIALLKHKDCEFELHLRSNEKTFFPLNIFQKFLYRILRFDYIEGADYIDLMSERFKAGDLRGCKI